MSPEDELTYDVQYLVSRLTGNDVGDCHDAGTAGMLIKLIRRIAAPAAPVTADGPFVPGELTAAAHKAADDMRAQAQRPFLVPDPFLVPTVVDAIRAVDAVARVRVLHRQHEGTCTKCFDYKGDAQTWPCPTIVALDSI